MERWYEHGPADRRAATATRSTTAATAPCESCPTQVAIRTGRPQVGRGPLRRPGRRAGGRRSCRCFPLFDDARKLFCLIEYVREITDLNQDAAHRGEPQAAGSSSRTRRCRSRRSPWRCCCARGDEAERRVAEDIASNIEALVLPLVARLKARCSDPRGRAGGRSSWRSGSGRSPRPLTSRLSGVLRSLTSREREIASLVLQGKTSKEIAERLCLTIKAVEFHRTNLRKKLGWQAEPEPQANLASSKLTGPRRPQVVPRDCPAIFWVSGPCRRRTSCLSIRKRGARTPWTRTTPCFSRSRSAPSTAQNRFVINAMECCDADDGRQPHREDLPPVPQPLRGRRRAHRPGGHHRPVGVPQPAVPALRHAAQPEGARRSSWRRCARSTPSRSSSGSSPTPASSATRASPGASA